MATTRYYLANTVTVGWQTLTPTVQSAALLTAGWVVGTGNTFSSEHNSGAATDRASTTFVANTVPDATLDTSLKDAFRSATPLNGTFASANWSFQFSVQSTIQSGAAAGQIVFRILKADLDGSNATQITSAQQSASICSAIAATNVNGTLTLNPGAFTITNQYLFIQVAWKRTTAGGMTTTNVRLATGSAATPVGTSILTSDFTNATVLAPNIAATSVLNVPTVAIALDVTVDASVSTAAARGARALVFPSQLVGYCFTLDSTGVFGYVKTTDGGATWGSQIAVDGAAATTVVAFDIWFDGWTPGDQGTLIHCWWFDSTNNVVRWRTLNITGDALGTVRTVFTGASAVAGRGAFVSGTKTRSGYLYCAYDLDAGAERGLHRSTDSGTTWSTNLATTFVEATLDTCKLFPASGTGDNNDCWALYYDASALALTLKLWDSSAVAQVESATIGVAHTDGPTDLTGQYGYDGAVRHTDGHLIVAALSARDVAASQHQVFDITSTSVITTKTAIAASTDDHYFPQVFINQGTGTIFVAYNGKRDGSEDLDTATKVYFTHSFDGGASWGVGDNVYQQDAAGPVQQVWTPMSGSRFYVIWRVGTTLLGNFTNSLIQLGSQLPTIDPTSVVNEPTVTNTLVVTGTTISSGTAITEPSVSGGAVAWSGVIVQKKFANTQTASTSATFDNPVAGGNTIVALMSSFSGAATAFVVTDNRGGVYQSAVFNGTTDPAVGASFSPATAGGTTTVTASVTTTSNWQVTLHIFEVQGVLTLEGTPVTARGTTASMLAGNLTPAGAALLFSYFSKLNALSIAPGTGWTEESEIGDGSLYLSESQSRFVATGGTYVADAGGGVDGQKYGAMGMSFTGTMTIPDKAVSGGTIAGASQVFTPIGPFFPKPYALLAHVGVSLGQNGGTTSAINSAGANLLLIHLAWYPGGGGTSEPVVSDSFGNTWIKLTKRVQNGGIATMWLYAEAPMSKVGSGHTATAAAADVYPAISFSAWEGAPPFPVVMEDGASGVGLTTSSSVTPVEDGSLIVSGYGLAGGGGTANNGAGLTEMDEVAFASGANEGGGVGWKVQAVAAPLTVVWTLTGSAYCASNTVVFKPSAPASQAIAGNRIFTTRQLWGPSTVVGGVITPVGTIVQSKTATVSGDNEVYVILDTPVRQGNTLIGFLFSPDTVLITNTAEIDSEYRTFKEYYRTPSTAPSVLIAYNPGAEGNQVEMYGWMFGATKITMVIVEVQGLFVPDVAGIQNSGTTAAMSAGTLTPPGAALLFGLLAKQGSSNNAPGAGWTELQDLSDGTYQISVEKQTVATGGAVAVTGSGGSDGAAYTAFGASFRDVTGSILLPQLFPSTIVRALAQVGNPLYTASTYATLHLPFDEVSGPRMSTRGPQPFLEVGGAIGSVAAKFGLGANFVRSNFRILSAAHDAAFQPAAGVDFTLRCWVKLNGIGTTQALVTKRDWNSPYAGTFELYYYGPTNHFEWVIGDSAGGVTGTSNSTAVVAGTWYLIHACYDHTLQRVVLSLNGVNWSYYGIPAGYVPNWAGSLDIGAYNIGYFDGVIDDLVLMPGYYMPYEIRSFDYSSNLKFLDWNGTGGPLAVTTPDITTWLTPTTTLFTPTVATTGAQAVTGATIAATQVFAPWVGNILAVAIPYATLHLPCDESSGNRVDTIAGKVFTESGGTIGSATGKFGSAAQFVAASPKMLTTAHSAAVNPPAGADFMIRVWVKLASKSDDQSILTKIDNILPSPPITFALAYLVSSDMLSFSIGTSAAGGTGGAGTTDFNFGSPPLNTWFLVHAWYEQTTQKVFISTNAGTETGGSFGGLTYQGNSTAPLEIGWRSSAIRPLDGQVDDLVILQGTFLTASQRAADYAAGAGVPFLDWTNPTNRTVLGATIESTTRVFQGFPAPLYIYKEASPTEPWVHMISFASSWPRAAGAGTLPGFSTLFANLIVLHVSWTAGDPVPAVSDNQGNTWVPLTRAESGTTIRSQFYYCANPITAFNHTFSANTHGDINTYVALGFSAWNGLGVVTTVFDVEAGAANASAATLPISLTPTKPSTLVLTGLASGDNGGVNPTIDAGFTLQANWNWVNSFGRGNAIASLVQGVAAATTVTWNNTNAAPVAGVIASFKLAPVATGTVVSTLVLFTPTVIWVQAVTAGGLTSASQVFAPVVERYVLPTAIVCSTRTMRVARRDIFRSRILVLRRHRVATPPAAVGDQSVTATIIASASQLFAATLAPGPITITSATRATTLAVNAPTPITTGPVTVTGGTQPTTLALNGPTITVGPVTVLATSLAPAVQLFAPTLLPQPVTVIGGTRATAWAVFAPALAAVALGATILSGSGLFPPSVTQNISTGTVAPASQLFIPTVVRPAVQAVTCGTIAAGSALTAPTLAPGPVTVTAPTVASTFQIFLPIVSLAGITNVGGNVITTTANLFGPTLAPQPVTVVNGTRPTTVAIFAPSLTAVSTGATIVSGSGLFPPALALAVTLGTRPTSLLITAPSLAVGPVTVTGATIPAASQLFVPSVGIGAVVVGGATLPSSLQLFAPSLAGAVTTGTRATTLVLFAPSLAGALTTATIPATTVLFPPTALATGALGGGTVASTLQLFALTVTTGAITITGPFTGSVAHVDPPSLAGTVVLGTRGTTVVLNGPSLTVGPVTLIGGTIPSATQLFGPLVGVGATAISGAFIGSTAQLFVPAMIYRLDGPFIPSTAGLFPPTLLVHQALTAGTILAGSTLTPPALLPISGVTGGTILSSVTIFAPAIPSLVRAPFLGSTAVLFGPSAEPVVGVIVVGGLPSTLNLFGPSIGKVLVDMPPEVHTFGVAIATWAETEVAVVTAASGTVAIVSEITIHTATVGVVRAVETHAAIVTEIRITTETRGMVVVER